MPGNSPVLPALSTLFGLTQVRNGTYARLFELDGLQRGTIYRKKCPGCKVQFSLLPNDMVPLHSYGLSLICSRLSATIAGQPCWSRDFYEQHELVPDETAPQAGRGQSWSDRVSDSPPCPSPQLFRHWARKWPLRAQDWMQRLLLACLCVGCDLKGKLGHRLLPFFPCPDAMRALPVAAGLVSLLTEEPDWFPAAVRLLAFCSSHKIFRAAGRPPPHYGGALRLAELREP